MSHDQWYLDCYFYGALGGEDFPVNSWGPASLEDINDLDKRISKHFNRTEVVKETKGLNPRSQDRWDY